MSESPERAEAELQEEELRNWDDRLKEEARGKNPSRAAWIPLTAALITAMLGLILANSRPYFHDEAATWYYSAFGLLELFSKLSQDVHPPLYFLSAYTILLTKNLFLVRVFSVLCGAFAVGLVAHRATKSMPQGRAWMLAFLLCTSPFLIFLFHFARYYAFVCLLVVALALAIERYAKSQRRFDCIMIGLICALLMLTNYAAGLLVAVPTLMILICWCALHEQPWNAFFAIVPAWLSGLSWLPFLLGQMGDGFDGRTSPALSSLAKGFVLNGGYMAYSFGAGDALMPWSVGGIVVGVLGVVTFCWGLFICLWQGGRARIAALGVLIMLAVSALLGAVIMDGAGFIFFPSRVGWVYLLWFAVAVGIPLALNKAPQGLLVLCGVCNGIGMVALLGTNTTTVWAYQVPSAEIATYVLELKEANPKASVMVNRQSLGNIAYELEQRSPGILDNPCPPKGSMILIGEAAAPAWPPTDAVNADSTCTPRIPYNQSSERFFLSENKGTLKAKQRFMKRDVLPEKIVVRLFVKPTK